VLATGTSYNSPWRGDEDVLLSSEQRETDWKEIRERIKDSPSVLCVGAGATGLESASFIKETYPDK